MAMALARRAAVLGLLCAAAADAHAGGMVLPVRGVRDLERGGALIAGADDADALWLDPAGLAHLVGDGDAPRTSFVVRRGVRVPDGRLRADRQRRQPCCRPVSNQQPGHADADDRRPRSRRRSARGRAAASPRRTPASTATTTTGSQRYASISLAGSAFVYLTARRRVQGQPIPGLRGSARR